MLIYGLYIFYQKPNISNSFKGAQEVVWIWLFLEESGFGDLVGGFEVLPSWNSTAKIDDFATTLAAQIIVYNSLIVVFFRNLWRLSYKIYGHLLPKFNNGLHRTTFLKLSHSR